MNSWSSISYNWWKSNGAHNKAPKPKSQPKVCQMVQVFANNSPIWIKFSTLSCVLWWYLSLHMSWCWTYALFKCANDLVKMKLIIVKVIMDSNHVTYLIEQRKGMLISINTIYMYKLHCLISSKQCLPQMGVIKKIAH